MPMNIGTFLKNDYYKREDADLRQHDKKSLTGCHFTFKNIKQIIAIYSMFLCTYVVVQKKLNSIPTDERSVATKVKSRLKSPFPPLTFCFKTTAKSKPKQP
jgi:hypothetical protein